MKRKRQCFATFPWSRTKWWVDAAAFPRSIELEAIATARAPGGTKAVAELRADEAMSWSGGGKGETVNAPDPGGSRTGGSRPANCSAPLLIPSCSGPRIDER